MPITASSRHAPPARPNHAGPAPSIPNWLKPPIWNIPPAAATARPSHGRAVNHAPPDIAERMRHCAASSFGRPSSARAAAENDVNGVARDDVLRIMMVARSGNLVDAHRLFERVHGKVDLVFRGTRLSTLVRACPDSTMRTQWLRELESPLRAAAPARAPAAAAPVSVARPVGRPAPVQPHPGTGQAAEPRAVAPVVRKTDAYDHLVRSPLSVCEPVSRGSVAGRLAARPPKGPPRHSQAAPAKPWAEPVRQSQATPPPLPPKPPGWENRIRQPFE